MSDPTDLGTRIRTQTEKGIQYEIETLQSRFRSTVSHISKDFDSAHNLLQEKGPKDPNLSNIASCLQTKFDELQEITRRLRALVTDQSFIDQMDEKVNQLRSTNRDIYNQVVQTTKDDSLKEKEESFTFTLSRDFPPKHQEQSKEEFIPSRPMTTPKEGLERKPMPTSSPSINSKRSKASSKTRGNIAALGVKLEEERK